MTLNEQIKILDNKIRSNQAQYNLDRQNPKISPLSSGELEKYEYLTGEDLGYKSDAVQRAKFEYSPLGQVFNKGLEKGEKQVGLMKRIKNIEDKTDNQLKENRDKQLGIRELFRAIYYGEILISAVEREQDNFDDMIETKEDSYQFTDKLNLKNLNKNIALVNASIYYTWKNIKSE